MGLLVRIWVTRLGEYFHTRRRQRACLLYVFSCVLFLLLDKEKYMSHYEQGKGLWVLWCLFLWLGESLVTLGAGKGLVSCNLPLLSNQATRHRERHVTQWTGKGLISFMSTLVGLWMTRLERVLSHQEKAKGLPPVWILWYVFRWIHWDKVLSQQRRVLDKIKFLSGVLICWWASRRPREGTDVFLSVQLSSVLVFGQSGTDKKSLESALAWMFLYLINYS